MAETAYLPLVKTTVAVCIYVNNRWCMDVQVVKKHCCADSADGEVQTLYSNVRDA